MDQNIFQRTLKTRLIRYYTKDSTSQLDSMIRNKIALCSLIFLHIFFWKFSHFSSSKKEMQTIFDYLIILYSNRRRDFC